jgi:hypothetical protein
MSSRRDLLRLSAAGLLAPSCSRWLPALAARAADPAGKPRPKACILLWMNGGPAQGLTFDVKDGGPYKPAETAAPGVRISEHLSRLGAQAKHLALVRGMSTGVSSHGTAHYLMGTGYPSGAMKRPAVGSVVAQQLGNPDAVLPNFVVIDGGQAGGLGVLKPPFHPAYAGPKNAPMMIDDPAKGVSDLKPLVPDADFARRAADLDEDNRAFLAAHAGDAALAHATTAKRAVSLMRSDTFRALNVENEPPKLREAYGPHKFGQACLLARRLVETGVSFVEVVNDGWDDHGGAVDKVKNRTFLDAGFAALLADLKDRGMLDSTLVVWMGEFGRTPSLNHGGHHCKAWTTVLAGAGVKGGQAVGRTDKVGDVVEDRPVDAPAFTATVFKALGIDPAKKVDNNGFRVPIVDKGGEPLPELF